MMHRSRRYVGVGAVALAGVVMASALVVLSGGQVSSRALRDGDRVRVTRIFGDAHHEGRRI